MRRVCIVQPVLTTYRIPLFLELAEHFQIDVLYSRAATSTGYGAPEPPSHPRVRWRCIPTFHPVGNRIGMFQSGITSYMYRERPDALVIFANPRFLSFWTTLIWGRLLGIPVYPHGHGLFKKRSISILFGWMYHAILALSTRYICYTPSVAASFGHFGFPTGKLAVADNATTNPTPTQPIGKSGKKRGLLFIGRLRSGCEIETLVDTVGGLRDSGCPDLTLHIIGGGELEPIVSRLARSRPWISVYGQVYEPDRIRQIADHCIAGVYPGNAGLSVLHMMSLSLPPITHDDLPGHEGPEPSYIQSGENGLLFNRSGGAKALAAAIRQLYNDPGLGGMQQQAFATYLRLTTPSLASRFALIIFPQGLPAVSGTTSL